MTATMYHTIQLGRIHDSFTPSQQPTFIQSVIQKLIDSSPEMAKQLYLTMAVGLKSFSQQHATTVIETARAVRSATKKEEEKKEENEPQSPPNILNIPCDIQEEIAKYLNIRESINFGRAHRALYLARGNIYGGMTSKGFDMALRQSLWESDFSKMDRMVSISNKYTGHIGGFTFSFPINDLDTKSEEKTVEWINSESMSTKLQEMSALTLATPESNLCSQIMMRVLGSQNLQKLVIGWRTNQCLRESLQSGFFSSALSSFPLRTLSITGIAAMSDQYIRGAGPLLERLDTIRINLRMAAVYLKALIDGGMTANKVIVVVERDDEAVQRTPELAASMTVPQMETKWKSLAFSSRTKLWLFKLQDLHNAVYLENGSGDSGQLKFPCEFAGCSQGPFDTKEQRAEHIASHKKCCARCGKNYGLSRGQENHTTNIMHSRESWSVTLIGGMRDMYLIVFGSFCVYLMRSDIVV